jgi:hypothetical protein
LAVFRLVFMGGFLLITALFILAAAGLGVFAVAELWIAFDPSQQASITDRFNAVLETVGLLTIAVAALELSQTILEEEVRREAHLAAPTRVRRFLSRFMVVIIVSLSIEFLVIVFRLMHQDPSPAHGGRGGGHRRRRAPGGLGRLHMAQPSRGRARARRVGGGEKRGPEGVQLARSHHDGRSWRLDLAPNGGSMKP